MRVVPKQEYAFRFTVLMAQGYRGNQPSGLEVCPLSFVLQEENQVSPSTTEINQLLAPETATLLSPNALMVQWSLRLLGGFALLAGILFLSAWTLLYWQAAVYLLAVFVPAAPSTDGRAQSRPAGTHPRLPPALSAHAICARPRSPVWNVERHHGAGLDAGHTGM
jgi:hypothetical protein